MYSLGIGVPQDYEEAAKWNRKAAEQNFVKCAVQSRCESCKGSGNAAGLCESAEMVPEGQQSKGHARGAKHSNFGGTIGVMSQWAGESLRIIKRPLEMVQTGSRCRVMQRLN